MCLLLCHFLLCNSNGQKIKLCQGIFCTFCPLCMAMINASLAVTGLPLLRLCTMPQATSLALGVVSCYVRPLRIFL